MSIHSSLSSGLFAAKLYVPVVVTISGGGWRKGSRDIKMSGVRTWWHVRVERECEEGGYEEGEVGGGWGCEEDGMEIGDRHYRRIGWNQRPWKRRGCLPKQLRMRGLVDMEPT